MDERTNERKTTNRSNEKMKQQHEKTTNGMLTGCSLQQSLESSTVCLYLCCECVLFNALCTYKFHLFSTNATQKKSQRLALTQLIEKYSKQQSFLLCISARFFFKLAFFTLDFLLFNKCKFCWSCDNFSMQSKSACASIDVRCANSVAATCII